MNLLSSLRLNTLAASAAVAVLTLASVNVARAQTATYTFEAPVFTVGSTTPLLNVGPNSGDASFAASFTSAPTANAFQIANYQPNGLITGQTLYSLVSTDPLTITFNRQVNQVTFTYAVNSTTAGSSLQATTPVGNFSQNATNVGGGAGFFGGTFNINSALGFTSLTLSAFQPTGARTQFSIDNLEVRAAVNPVPEPSEWVAMAMATTSVMGLMVRAKRRKKTAAGA